MEPTQRLHEIDLVKAVAIVTVVLIHAQDGLQGYDPALERFLREWTRFAVPLFLLAAGFLFTKSAVGTAELARKLSGRILLPYLICSIFMLWFRATWLFEPRLGTADPVALGLLLLSGRTLGIYYFVALISVLYALSLWWRQWPIPPLYLLWGVCGIGSLIVLNRPRIVVALAVVGAFMYLTGWLLSLHYAALRPRLRSQSGALLALALAVEVAYALLITRLPTGSWFYPPLTLAHYFAIFGGLLAVGVRWPVDAPPIRFLSESSYAIYLLHFPILRAMQYAFLTPQNAAQLPALLVPWIAATVATSLFILLFRQLLGRRSFYLIGA